MSKAKRIEPVLTATDKRWIREIVQYEVKRSLDKIKSVERKVDYMSGKLMFKKIKIEP